MTASRGGYLLRVHQYYSNAIDVLKGRVQELKARLSEDEFRAHPDVKFAARLRRATLEIIPENPDLPDYRLKGPLRKYRRYKKGLQRYRLFYCYASHPPIIVYLYVNDEKTQRKEGAKTDPYSIFTKVVERGEVSSNPNDEKLQKWISGFS